jgi:hypothetical protein
MLRDASVEGSKCPKCHHLPPPRIRHGIAEEVEEEGLGEGVELGEGGAALGPQRVRRVEDPRDPLLLGEGREGDFKII